MTFVDSLKSAATVILAGLLFYGVVCSLIWFALFIVGHLSNAPNAFNFVGWLAIGVISSIFCLGIIIHDVSRD